MRRLDRWENIAAYLRKSVKQARRYETSEYMPVHRHKHSDRSSVYALTNELDEWLQTRDSRGAGDSSDYLPGAESMLFEDRGPYTIKAADEEDVRWMAWLGSRVYKEPHDRIPEPTMLAWHSASPTGFSIVRDGKGQRIGNIDILPLRKAMLDEFVAGQRFEREFKREDLYKPDERGHITDLYIESFVAVLSPADGRPPDQAAGRAVLAAFPDLITRVCDASKAKRIYAIAASGNGVRVLSHLGFEIIGKAEDRVDGHPLWSASLSSVVRRLVRLFRNVKVADDTLRELLKPTSDDDEGGL